MLSEDTYKINILEKAKAADTVATTDTNQKNDTKSNPWLWLIIGLITFVGIIIAIKIKRSPAKN